MIQHIYMILATANMLLQSHQAHMLQ